MENPNVVIAGPVCIDHNETEGRAYTGWGSPAMYMATYLRRAHDLEPVVLSAYGEDFLPHQDGVQLLPEQPQAIDTLQFRNIITSSHRSWYAENIDSADPPELDEASIAALGIADIFILGTILPNYSPDYVKQLVSALPDHCLKAIIVQGYLRHVDDDSLVSPRIFEEAEAVLPLFDVAIISTDDHPEASKMAAEWCTKSLIGATVLTQGEDGATVFEVGEEPNQVSTERVSPDEIVDSVGCGDVFVAELAYAAFINGGHIVKATGDANRAAGNKLLART